MADDVISLKINLEANTANMTLQELEDHFEAMKTKLKGIGRGDAEFQKLSNAMARTTAEIKNIEIGFEGLDRTQIASELGAVAGGVSAITASLILMGGENETMREMGQSIQAALAITMGMKGAIEVTTASRKLYNNLLEAGKIEQIKETIATSIATAKTWLLDTAKKASAVTTGVLTGKIKIATVAQKVFNAVLKANPIALIVTAVLAAGAAFLVFAKNTGKAAKEQKALSDSLEAVSTSITSVYEEVTKMENAFALAKDGVISKEEALKTYNETIGQTIGEATTLEEAEQKFSDNTAAYIKAATLRAQAQQLIKMAAEEQTAALLAGEDDNRSWYETTLGFWSDASAAIADYSTLGLFNRLESSKAFNESLKEGATERLVNEKKANADKFAELARSLDAEAGLIEKNNGFISDIDKKASDDKAKADKASADKASAARKAQREKDAEAARLKLIEEAKTLAEFNEEQARIKIQLIQDEGERKRAEIEYSAQLELEALEKKGALTFDAEMLIAQTKNKALADLEKAEEDKRFALEKEAQAKRDEYDKLLFDAKLANEQEETEKKKLQLEEDYQNNITRLEEEGLLTMELEFELAYAREQALFDINEEFREKERQGRLALNQERLESATQVIGAIGSLNSAALATDLKNAGDNEALKERLRKASFEREKKLNIAMALVNGAQAQMSILAQTPKADFGIATAIAMGAAAITTLAQIAAIKSTNYQGGGSVAASTSSDVSGAGGAGAGAQINAVTNTSTILGNQQVYVTETDITTTQNNVSVIEESATF